MEGQCAADIRRGVPVVVLQPPETEDAVVGIAEIRKSCDGYALGGLSIREMIERGRRSTVGSFVADASAGI